MLIENSIVINRPIDEVFDVATCLRRCVVWRSALLASTKTSGGPVGVGTTFEQEVRGLGRSFRNTAVITAYEPPRLFAYKRSSGPTDYEARFTFEPEGAGTRFNVSVEGEAPSGWLRVLPKSLLRQWTQNTISQEMDTLKMMMENEVDLEAALATS
jgi:uncharacterized membrane protein